jgi:hypothetical protein
VIIGDSRALFDLDLDQMEAALGRRPIQLGLVGSCAYPVLDALASDPSFRGTVVCSLVPAMFLVPAGPPVENSNRALQRHRNWTWAERSGHHLGVLLDERLAFINQDDLKLEMLLKRLPIPNRPEAQVGPRLPPYFSTLDRERRTWMLDSVTKPGPFQDRIKHGWIPLFTPRHRPRMCRRRPSWRPSARRSNNDSRTPPRRWKNSAPAGARWSSCGCRSPAT